MPGISRRFAAVLLAFAAAAAAAAPYAMAPAAAYLMPDRVAEIAFARTAAPPAISAQAAVMVLGTHGYEPAVPGKNGFVCLVQRAWFSNLGDADGFWNPALRAPICFNPEAARSVLPTYLQRSEWAMAGVPRPEMIARTRAGMAAGTIARPEPGALTYMMSRQGYLGDGPHGPWHSHLMFFTPPMPTADWGADLPGTGVYGQAAGADPFTLFFVPVATWSDGTPDMPHAH